MNRDVKKFIRESFDCQKVKPPKIYCKPKLVPLAPSRTLELVTMDMAGPLPITKEGHKLAYTYKIHIGNMRSLYKAYKSLSYEDSNRARSRGKMLGLLPNVWNPRVSTHRSEFKLYESNHRESVGTLGRTHASYKSVPPSNRRHHRTFQ